MTKSFIVPIMGIVILTSLVGCYNPRKGALSTETRTELDELSSQVKRETEEKYHILADKIALVLEEALNRKTDEAMIAYTQKFISDNEFALTTLSKEIDEWFKFMNEEDRNRFFMVMLTESYPSRLRRLIPAYRARLDGRPKDLENFEQLLKTIEFRK